MNESRYQLKFIFNRASLILRRAISLVLDSEENKSKKDEVRVSNIFVRIF